MKKNLRFTRGLALAAFVIFMLAPGLGWGQILTESFNYTANATDGLAKQSGGVWKKLNTGDSILVVTGNLSYTGFPTSSGNSVSFGGAGTDYYTSFSSQTSGTVYMSFLLNIANLGSLNATGGYPIGLLDGGTSAFVSRVFIRLSGTSNFNLGIQPGSIANVSYASNTLSTNTTYLVVISYNFISGQNNDVSKIWINPIPGSIEPTSDASATGAHATAEVTSIQRTFLRQDATSATPSILTIDEIRIGTTWSSVTPSGVIVAPTTQATNITFSSVASTTFTASWTNGNGSNRAVFVKQTNTGLATPANTTTYTANTTFGSGTQIGSTGWYCVYNGTGTTVGITGLSASTDYMVHVCEYNGTAGSEAYNTTSGTNNPLNQTTSAGFIAPSITSPTATSVTSTTAILGGNITSDGGSAITERGTVWSITSPVTITDNKIAEGTNATGIFTQSRTSLPSNSLVYYAAYATNIIGTTLSTEASFTTLKAEPSNHATGFSASIVTPTYSAIDVVWTDATGGTLPDGYVVKASTVDYTSIVVADAVTETPGTLVKIVAPGTEIAHFTGLTGSTPYFFKIFPYTNSGTNIDYKTDSPPQATATTDAAPSVNILINEVDSDNPGNDAAEFIELYDGGVGNTDLTGLVVVLYNGSNDLSYAAYDLDSYSTNAQGYFVIGSTGMGTQIEIAPGGTGWLQNGADAVALYYADGSNFPTNTAITTANLLDAFVYDTDDADDAGLLVLLNSSQPQINENGQGNTASHSSQRLPNGTGGLRNTTTFDQTYPTPGAANAVLQLTWTGTTSTDWAIATNWNPNILPDLGTNASIPDVSNDPIIGGVANCKNLSISTSAKLEISFVGKLTVNGSLTNSAGNDGLVIKSSVTGTGSLKHNTSDVPATIERYIDGSTTLTEMKYHQVSIPLTAAANPTSNLFTGSYLFDFTESAAVSGDWNPLGGSTSTALNVDKGYLIYYPEASTTYTFAGPMRNGTVTPALSFTDAAHGFNLVPNPYPSAIDWTLIPTKTNLNDAFWIWNPTTSNFGAYGTEVGTGTSATTKDIASGQAFFVRATAASPILSMDNSSRLHSSQAFLKNATNVENQLRIAVAGNNSTDEVLVAFKDAWSFGSDNADVDKMYGAAEAPQLSCVSSEGKNLSIDALPFSQSDVIVPLNFSLQANTDVTFTASGMESFYMGIPVYLEDLELNTVTDLRTNPEYTFSHTSGSENNRFQLRFMGVTATPDIDKAIQGNVFVSNGYLFVDIPSMLQSASTINVYDALGRQLSSRKVVLNGVTQIPAPAATGVYVVRVISGSKTFVGKVVVK